MNALEDYFKIVNIDDLSERETKELGLSVVPTLIDSDIDTPFEGTKAWEYVRNQKYFNHPTNNIEYTKNGIPKPIIEEDIKANISKTGSGFIYVDQDVEKKFIDKDDKHNFDRVFDVKENKTEINVTNKNSTQPTSRPSILNKLPMKIAAKPPIQAKIASPSTQPKIASPAVKENSNINNIVTQRSNEDRKLFALMKLRKI